MEAAQFAHITSLLDKSKFDIDQVINQSLAQGHVHASISHYLLDKFENDITENQNTFLQPISTSNWLDWLSIALAVVSLAGNAVLFMRHNRAMTAVALMQPRLVQATQYRHIYVTPVRQQHRQPHLQQTLTQSLD